MIRHTYRSRLPQIEMAIADAMDEVARLTADAIAEGAKARVPVDSGDLQRAIHVERHGDRDYSVVGGDDKAFYGHMVEFGAAQPGGHAQPFLVPAAEVQRQDYENDARRAIDRATATAGKRL